ncbi:MAG: transposase [Gemmataceae bacterium]
MRKRYDTDLTDEQWSVIGPLLPPAKAGGRPREVDLREVVNTLLYQARTGVQWGRLPHDLVPESTAWDYFARLRPVARRRHVAEGRGRRARGGPDR